MKVQMLRPGPDAIIVLRPRQHLAVDQIERLIHRAERVFGDFRVGVLEHSTDLLILDPHERKAE